MTINSVNLDSNETVFPLSVNKKLAYVENCDRVVKEFTDNTPTLIKYVRNKKNVPVGAVVAYVDDESNELMIGWSKCNVTKDRFYKKIAVYKALQRAVGSKEQLEALYDKNGSLPQQIKPVMAEILNRSLRYFKDQQ